MPATVQIDEQNGSAPGVTTSAITNSNWGSVDSPNLDPVVNYLNPGDYSYEKWQKMNFTALGGLSKVNNFKVWRVGALGGLATHKTNLHDPPVNSSYATPVNTISGVAVNAMPTSVPTNTNIGVAGTTNGLTVPGTTDYIVHQIKTDPTDIQGATNTMYYQWDEIA